jgi:hypothetical protein
MTRKAFAESVTQPVAPKRVEKVEACANSRTVAGHRGVDAEVPVAARSKTATVEMWFMPVPSTMELADCGRPQFRRNRSEARPKYDHQARLGQALPLQLSLHRERRVLLQLSQDQGRTNVGKVHGDS